MTPNASLANSEDPDEMPHNAAFHQGLHCLLRQKIFLEKEKQLIRKFRPVTPQFIQWTIPCLLYKTRGESPLDHKGLNTHYILAKSSNRPPAFY